MVQDWLLEFGFGTAKLFLHPVLYISLFLAAYLGVARVKRERKHFHVRAENAYFEMRQLLPLGMLLGAILSILVIVAGIVVPFAAILFIAAITAILSFQVRLLSPVYTVGLPFFLVLFLAGQDWNLPFGADWLSGLEDKLYPSMVVLLALLVIAEGILIFKNGSKATSPNLITSKRGQRVGAHELKRVWMVPLFLLIPGDAITIPFEWWPVFSIGGNEVSIILVPFLIGHIQQVQAYLPKQAVKMLGKQVIYHGLFVTILAVASFWVPVIAIATVAIAVFGRELIALNQRLKEENRPSFFAQRNHGVMILGVLPNSPAEKMALAVGEIITKVNGMTVRDEKSVYEALQRNAAHCKLEVLDVNDQIRFVQRALYEGDHHELGILFVQGEKKWGTEAV